MSLIITRKILVGWAGFRVVQDAESLVDRGLVMEALYDPPYIRGSVLWHNRPLKTALKILPDGSVENECPCWANTERGIVCNHAIALGVVLIRRSRGGLRVARMKTEQRRAARLTNVDESQYITRVSEDTPGALPATIRLGLGPDWMEGCRQEKIPLFCRIEYGDESRRIDEVPKNLPLIFSAQDESLLFVLEDICDGPARGTLELSPNDFVNILRLRAGRQIENDNDEPVTVNKTAVVTHIRMDLDDKTGELLLRAHTELPFLETHEPPLYIVAGRWGWAYGAENFWPLENVLPEPYHPIYSQPVTVGRTEVVPFLKNEMPGLTSHARLESDISADLFTVEPGDPVFRLQVKGSPASLSATLYASYDGYEFVACRSSGDAHFGIPDPDDLMRYTVRNLDAETRGLQILARTGFAGDRGDDLTPIVGSREVLAFFGSHLPALRRLGWRVQIEGRVAPHVESLSFVTPVVHIRDPGGTGWFDVGFTFEGTDGGSISHADIQEAMRKGEASIEKDGRTLLIDSGAIESMFAIFADCASSESTEPGHFRLAEIYAPYVGSSLDSIEGIDVEDTADWRARSSRYNRKAKLEPAPIRKELNDILRPYQKTGVSWLRFLEQSGFCGLLADEMGLGKTVQALAWFEADRLSDTAGKKPSLIVCPTSLVENWVEEAQKFTPKLNLVPLSGNERKEKWADLSEKDIGVTSYALLRRDVEYAVDKEFAIVLLDEAQHIKNRSTRNAVAAKKLRAEHRLVLTGTPVENSVADLWSIMDFLMPGYLGNSQSFRSGYELPIARGGDEGALAASRLKRKLHPFLLRRMKKEVARDLPEKIERVSTCTLTRDQQTVYRELLESSRRRISDMVRKNGFDKNRMEILTTLMRLRQVCCHLGLLKLPGIEARYPSAKMELFFELLDEALDSGHRVLVFSQFVSMLSILREEMEARDLAYCYLDGSTKDRMRVVHRFNTQRDIPAFLISLKAGGTGLNLTGADMVVHFDPWWNPAVENQATDRAYRIGQKRTVYSVKLITKGTIEEKVLALQQRKKAVIDATVEADGTMAETLTWDDIQELLSV